jgi:hypothetical protein
MHNDAFRARLCSAESQGVGVIAGKQERSIVGRQKVTGPAKWRQ